MQAAFLSCGLCIYGHYNPRSKIFEEAIIPIRKKLALSPSYTLNNTAEPLFA